MQTTYKIIGGDGREYGPVPLDELDTWVTEGRVVGSTLIWNSAEERWYVASQLSELQPRLKAVAGVNESGPDTDASASVWSRLAAFLVDTLLISTLANLLWPTLAGLLDIEIKALPSPSSWELLAQYAQDNVPRLFFLQLCRLTAETLFLGWIGATPGKLIAGIRVVRQDGGRLGYPRAALRFVARWFSEVPLYAGYLPIVIRRDRRGLHDLLAGTKVVLAKRPARLDRMA